MIVITPINIVFRSSIPMRQNSSVLEQNSLSRAGRRAIAGGRGGGGSNGFRKPDLSNSAIKGKAQDSGRPTLADASRRGQSLRQLFNAPARQEVAALNREFIREGRVSTRGASLAARRELNRTRSESPSGVSRSAAPGSPRARQQARTNRRRTPAQRESIRQGFFI